MTGQSGKILNSQIVTIVQDNGGALWLGTSDQGLIRRLPDGTVEHYTAADSNLPNDSIDVLYKDANGRIWAGMRWGENTSTGGLCLFNHAPGDGKSLVERNYTQRDGLPSNWVTALYQDSGGKFWVGTVNTLCLLQTENRGKSICRKYSDKQNGFGSGEIWSIAEDKDKNLWLGTRNGVYQVKNNGFVTFSKDEYFGFPYVNSFFENDAGELFVGFRSHSTNTYFAKIEGEKILPGVPVRNGKRVGWGWNQMLWQDRRGVWWIPTDSGLLRSPPVKSFQDLRNVPLETVDTKISSIFRLFEDSRGDIWISGGDGSKNILLRWERARDIWHDYTADIGEADKRVATAFAESKNGDVWIAFGGWTDFTPLIRYRDGKLKIFDQPNGGSPPGWTTDLHFDAANNLWAANSEWGLLRLKDANAEERLEFDRYDLSNGLSSNGANCVTEDEFGRIYAGTGRGLNRLNVQTGKMEFFSVGDGLPSSSVMICYRDRTNKLWFTAHGGVFTFQPESARLRQPPTMLITGLRIAGVAQPVSILGTADLGELRLEPEQRQASVDFLALGATLGELLNYEYRTQDSDVWTTTGERTINFANLATGKFTLEIRAVTADGIYSQPAKVSLNVIAPLWQRPWFIAAVLILFVLAARGLYRRRVARLLETERIRTLIATDLHDDIGSNLSKISVLSEVARMRLDDANVEPNRLLNSIAETSRQSVSSMSDIVWAINPKRDSVLEMTRKMREHAEEIFVPKGVKVEFFEPEMSAKIKLPMDLRRDVYLVFKEAVNNVAKHSNCAKVAINFQIRNHEITLKIEDDGDGFNKNSETFGNGLANMRSRVERLNGSFEIESQVNLGTNVKIRIPQN